MSENNRVINTEDGSNQPQIRIRNNPLMNPTGNSKSRKQLPKANAGSEDAKETNEQAFSPNSGGEKGTTTI